MIRGLALLTVLLGACSDEVFFTEADAGVADLASASDQSASD